MKPKNIEFALSMRGIGKAPSIAPTVLGVMSGFGLLSFCYSLGLAFDLVPIRVGVLWMTLMVLTFIMHRYFTYGGGKNGGWHFMTDPREDTAPVKTQDRNTVIDMGLTDIYRKVYQKGVENPETWVELIDTHPRFFVHVIYHDDLKLDGKSQLKKLARELGIETEANRPPPFQIVDSWGGGASAIIFPKILADGELPPVYPFNPDQVVKGKLISCLGVDVRGRPIRNNRNVAPHLMISGTTGSGKTIAFRNEIFSMKLSVPNIRIYSIDYKGGIAFAPHDKFTKDMIEGVKLLQWVKGEAAENWRIVSEAGHDNWFDYDKEFPGKLPPIAINIDEFPRFRVKGDRYLLEQWEIEKQEAKDNNDPTPIKPLLVLDIVGEFLQVYRAGGVFVTVGMQKPKADKDSGIPTEYRDMFDARVAMRVPDSAASGVAIDSGGAELLPEMGGMMFRIGSKPIQYGAASYITKEQAADLYQMIEGA